VARKGFLVSGQVQGVGYRWWTTRVACALGISGTVRNLSDGRVEVQAQGSDSALCALEEELLRGPASSRVDSVETFSVVADLTGEFRILL
jgi:acylphosphatase